MSKSISDAELRAALLKAHNYTCIYTNKIINENNVNIDHIIPQSLIKKPEKLMDLLSSLGLPSDFNLDSLDNFLPCHPSANRKKSDILFPKSTFLFYLDIAQKKKPLVEKNLGEIRNKNSLAKAMNIIEQGFNNGSIDREDIQNLVKTNIINKKEATLQPNNSNKNLNDNCHSQVLPVDEFEPGELAIINPEYNNQNHSYINNSKDTPSTLFVQNALQLPPSHSIDEKIRRHIAILSEIEDLGFFHLYIDEKSKASYLKGPGPINIYITDRCIDFKFNNSNYNYLFDKGRYTYSRSLTISIKPLFDIIISLIQNDQTLESFSLLYDFTPKTPNVISFEFKLKSNNLDSELFGLATSGDYFIQDNDKILDDQGRSLPPTLSCNYLDVLVLLYNIYWIVTRQKFTEV